MSCTATQDLILELPVARYGELEHLRSCASCRADAERIAAAESALDGWLDAYSGPDLDAALDAAHAAGPSRSRTWLAPLLLAAGVLLSLRVVPAPLTGELHTPTPEVHEQVSGDGDFVVLEPREGLTIIWHP